MTNSFTKYIAKSMTLLILGTSAVTMSSHAQAAEQPSQHAKQTQQFKINVKNNDVPQKVQQLAQQKYKGYAKALSKIENKQANDFYLGEPFKIYKFNGEEDNSFYYPVMKNGNISYILTLSPKDKSDLSKDKNNANYSVKISEFLADELNAYKQKNVDVTILTNQKGYYIEENGKVKLIQKTSLPGKNENSDQSTSVSPKIDQELKATSTPMKVNEEATNTDGNVQYENLLKDFKIREQQGDIPWCAGYSMAALLNATYNTDKYNAHDVMKAMYPNMNEEQLAQQGTYPQQMIDYGKSQGRDISSYDGMPSYDTVDKMTKENKGIMALLESQNPQPNDPHADHVVAVVGNAQINNQRTLVYWNPWDTQLSIQDADSNLLHLSYNRDYSWQESMVGY